MTARHCGTGPGQDSLFAGGTVDAQDPHAQTAHMVGDIEAPTLNDDWRVIKLDRKLKLPTLPLNSSPSFDDGMFTAMGWGQTKDGGPQSRYLMAADIPHISDTLCGKLIGNQFHPGSDLCMGNSGDKVIAVCHGDSGGPVVAKDDRGQWVQVGIISRGSSGTCETPNVVDINQKVSSQHQAILDAIQKLGG